MSGENNLTLSEEYYGWDFTDEKCERMLLERFGGGQRAFRKHFKKELQLFQTKWVDYRILHPVVATYLYAAEFVIAYKRYYTMTVDCEKGLYVKGFKGGDAWAASNSLGFIKGRQQADTLGIPYWFYISKAYEWLYIMKWKHLPRQVHLYREDVVEYVNKEWYIYSRESLVLSELDYFKDDANRDRPEYIAHQEWVRDRVALSSVPEVAMESLNERGYHF